MNIKRILSVIILFVGIFGCECFSPPEEWKILDVEISIHDGEWFATSNGSVAGDSVYLQFRYEEEFVENLFPSGVFINQAFATSCADPGHEGLSDPIENLVITSSVDFNNIKKGEPLNDIILVNGEESIEDWIARSEDWEHLWIESHGLLFMEQPTIAQTHVFTATFTMRSGRMVEGETEPVLWE